MKVALRWHLMLMFAIILSGALVVTGWYGSTTAKQEIGQLSDKIIQDHLRGMEGFTQQLVNDTEITSRSVNEIVLKDVYQNNLVATRPEIDSSLKTLEILLKDNPEIYFLSFTEEKSGTFWMVSTDPKRSKIFVQINEPRGKNVYRRLDWELTPFSKKLIKQDDNFKVDSRTRPYYTQAKAARRLTWTPSYEFLVSADAQPVFGVTCATPLYSKSGQLLGVATADMILDGLGRFLKRNSLSENSVNLVIEKSGDTGKIIATSGDSSKDQKLYEESALKAYANNIQAIRGEQELNLILKGSLGAVKLTPKYVRASTNWVIINLTPSQYFTQNLDDAIKVSVWFGMGMILLAMAITFIISNRITRPLIRLAKEADDIRMLNFEEPPALFTKIEEVFRLDSSIDRMRSGLRSFEKLVPASYVRSLIADGQEAKLGGEKRELTVLFVDIEGFTKYAEDKPLDDVIFHLNRFLEACTNELLLQGATIDKYLGDEVMAFWGAPHECSDRCVKAARAALRIQSRLDFLHGKLASNEGFGMKARIGITSGEMIVGNVGTHERMNYTAIGDRVNLASRLQSLNKQYGTRILVDEETALAGKSSFAIRQVDKMSVYGRDGVDNAYEIIGISDDPANQKIVYLSEIALQAYFNSEFKKAIETFEELQDLDPESGWASIMIHRCREFLITPPPADWDQTYWFGFK